MLFMLEENNVQQRVYVTSDYVGFIWTFETDLFQRSWFR